MSLLAFLTNAQVEEVKAPSRTGGGKAKPWWPADDVLAIRLWRSGAVFPSKLAVDRFNLEYPEVDIVKGDAIPITDEMRDKHNKAELQRQLEFTQEQAKLPEAERKAFVPKELKQAFKPSKFTPKSGVPGNGFDIIDSRLWLSYKGTGHMLFIAPVAKDQAKVDIFGATKYNDDGTPFSSVYDQGAKTYGEGTLLKAVKELYNIELNDEREFVDLMIIDELAEGDVVVNINKQFSQKMAIFPKRIIRGEKQGEADYEKRENAIVWGFIPSDFLQSETVGQEGVEAEATA